MTAFDSLTVGPDEWLILSPRHDMSAEQLQRAAAQIPEALRGRVMVVDQFNMAVVAKDPDEPVCASGCIGACEGHDREDPWAS